MKIQITQEVPEGDFCNSCSARDTPDNICLLFNEYLTVTLINGKRVIEKCERCLTAIVLK